MFIQDIEVFDEKIRYLVDILLVATAPIFYNRLFRIDFVTGHGVNSN